MKDTKTEKWPDYRLLKQSDAISFFHMQMPQWLFCDPKYIPLSLEAKVAYTFLFNRFQLSRLNNWVNEDSEVFIIYPREKLAEDMGISYRKAIQCCKELLAAGLIWEHRVGRGSANRIYMAAVILSEKNADAGEGTPVSSRSAEPAGLDFEPCPDAEPTAPKQDMQNPQVMKCGNGISASAVSADPDLPFWHPNKKEEKYIKSSDTETVSRSSFAREGVCSASAHEQDRPTCYEEDAYLLEDILERCELDVLPEDDAGVFRNAVTRLFYSNSFRVGNAVLPQPVIRSHLHDLDGTVLLDTREKLRRNLDKSVKNSTAYVMAALLNNIWEMKSDLMVDPYLNTLGAS